MRRMFRPAFTAALLLATALSPAWAAEPLRGVALVIGEGEYEALTPLANPERDARAMDDLLDDLGFDVTRVLDGDADELREEIAEFVEDAADADVALVYYSGHGVELGGSNYLVPVDAALASPDEAGRNLVPVDGLLDELARTVPVTIVLLDACRTSPFPAGQQFTMPDGRATLAVDGPGLEATRGPVPVAREGEPAESVGVVVGFAASPGEVALDGPAGGNSPYAAALLKHLRAGGYEFGDLMTLVSEEVYLETDARQLPWTNSSLRRFLTFGEALEEVDGDEALIREGRRSLLLTVAETPASTRMLVEATAAAEGV
ncbi:MAG TPA: caspase family protein, partial [Devosia sp.]|nr:caspase family protein [Devosia sp.]